MNDGQTPTPPPAPQPGQDPYLFYLMSIHGTVGELRGEMRGVKDHVTSVSLKSSETQAKLQAHIDDREKAHGKDVVEKQEESSNSQWQKWMAVLALAVAFITLAMEWGSK